VINETPANQRDMAMVFQSYALFPHLTVFENIAYGLRVRKLSEAAIKSQVGQVLALTELSGLEQRAPSQLSGGQQQRVALARALVMQPKVLLFDEPLSNLDAKLRIQMRSEIRRIQQTLGITSLYVTHDQEEAMVLSDQIVVMHRGRIQQMGAPVEIYRRPANRFVADFIGRANFLPVTVTGRQASGWQVRLLEQTLIVPGASSTLAAGQAALLLVRPESLRVHPAPLPATLPGTIRRTAYLGAQIEYELDMAGQPVLVVQADPGEQALYPAGAVVHLELLVENAYLLSATD
jgi:iron(III) transport system ATP-binding protein